MIHWFLASGSRIRLISLLTAVALVLTVVPVRAAQIDTAGKLKISSDDYTFSARLIGRVHLDGNFYRSSSDDKELNSGTFVRRARIGVIGNFREWNYEIEYDNATNEANLKNANVSRPFGPGLFIVGQFKVMESFDESSSSNDIDLMERPYVAELTPDFKIGVAYTGTAKIVGYSANLYNRRAASDGESRPTDSTVGIVGRAYVAPVNEKTKALHVGGSYAFESTDDTGALGRVSPIGRAEKYKNLEEFRFVFYERLGEHVKLERGIAEAAGVDGPLSFQAEYMKGRAKTNDLPKDTFNAWYAEAAYVLTGEARNYGFRRGQMNRPVPSRAWGALEAAARYQYGRREKVDNAKLTATELGLTYYANANVRFLVNYSWAHNELNDDRPRLLSTRMQFDF